MKKVWRRTAVVYLLVAAFLAGLAVIAVQFFTNGRIWATQRANLHLFSGGTVIAAGAVYDRDGAVLAQTIDGERVFNNSARIRKSTLHVVGDPQGYISTGIHSTYRTELTGYSFVNGLYSVAAGGKGNDLHLTISAELCATAYDALGSSKGAVAVYNYKTGEILCSVSTPTYDVRNKPEDIDSDTTGKYDGIYLDRVCNGLYVPGSVFKIVTCASAIDNIPDIFSQTFTCTGKKVLETGTVICSDVHGSQSFEQAFANSCNCAFAEIALQLGEHTLSQSVSQLGLLSELKVGKTSAGKCSFNVSGATPAELAWAGVGQHTTMVTPMHMLVLAGAIANAGTSAKPYLVGSVTSGETNVSTGKTSYLDPVMTSQTALSLSGLMRNNVTSKYGDSSFKGLEMCGKTGTAEIENGAPHAWFVGFSQKEDCPLAIAVVIENGGLASENALPVAQKVMKAAYNTIK
ncbi:MAG: penicillin-binding protein [Clostridiales bacterium]|nr:penicillin-binding protein [Clostridiales bacterium]